MAEKTQRAELARSMANMAKAHAQQLDTLKQQAETTKIALERAQAACNLNLAVLQSTEETHQCELVKKDAEIEALQLQLAEATATIAKSNETQAVLREQVRSSEVVISLLIRGNSSRATFSDTEEVNRMQE